MFSLIIYTRTVNGTSYRYADIVMKSERAIIEKKLYRNLSVSSISACDYDTLSQARHVQERFRASYETRESRVIYG